MVESDEQSLSAPNYTFEYAPRTRYTNVEFQLPEYASDQVLRIDSAADWAEVTLKPGIQAVVVGPNAGATDAHLLALAQAPKAFRHCLRAINAGGDSVSCELTLSDNVLRKCLRRIPWPNLEHFHLLGTPKVGSGNGGALSGLLTNCHKIQSIVIVYSSERPRLLDDVGMLYLLQHSDSPELVYVELVGFRVRKGAEPWIRRPTEEVEGLEFVFGVEGEQKIYKGYSIVYAQRRA